MRARNIKPGFFKNEVLGEMHPLGRLLFIGLWCMADRDGRLEDRPKRIKAEVLPYDDILAGENHGEFTVKSPLNHGDFTVTSLLDNLQAAGFIKRYTVKGQKLIQVENFQKHQSPHHTEKGLGFPGPEVADITMETEDHGCLTVNSRLEHGENPPDSLIPDSLIPDSRNNHSSFAMMGGRLKKPAQGRKASTEQWVNALGNGLKTWFEGEFWPVQLRKVGKKECAMAVYDLNPTEELRARMVSAYQAQCDRDFCKRELSKVPHPATWVNGGRWEDEVTDGCPMNEFDRMIEEARRGTTQ